MAERGRPTEYTEDLIDKVEQYITECVDSYEYIDATDREGKPILTHEKRFKVKLPSIEGLVVYLDIPKSDIYTWEKVHPDFLRVLNKLRAKQAELLLNNGLSGTYNSTISKLILTKHGYREGFEHSGPDGSPIKVEETTQKKIDAALDKI